MTKFMCKLMYATACSMQENSSLASYSLSCRTIKCRITRTDFAAVQLHIIDM